MTSLPITIAAVALGGAFGAAIRFAFIQFGVSGALGIFVLNVAGSFGLGFAVILLQGRSEFLSAFILAGVFGGLTTFSTYAGDAVRLLSEDIPAALLYIVGSVAAAIVACLLGGVLGRLIT